MIDLHTHSRISDGSYTVEELIRSAASIGLTHLALTDHDTTAGTEQAMKLSEQHGLHVLPGIEISAFDYKRGRRAHILGLMIKPGHSSLERLCAPLREARHEASRRMVQLLIAAGYPLEWERIEQRASGGTGVYKQHIMLELIELGLEQRIYGPLYKALFSRGGGDVPPGVAYVPLQYIDSFDAIAAIREAGGIPIIAHPGQYDSFDAIPEWVEAGLQGIEVYHPLHGSKEVERSKAIAEQFGLISTGGSDFHGHWGDRWVELGSFNPGMGAIVELERRKAMIQEQV